MWLILRSRSRRILGRREGCRRRIVDIQSLEMDLPTMSSHMVMMVDKGRSRGMRLIIMISHLMMVVDRTHSPVMSRRPTISILVIKATRQ